MGQAVVPPKLTINHYLSGRPGRWHSDWQIAYGFALCPAGVWVCVLCENGFLNILGPGLMPWHLSWANSIPERGSVSDSSGPGHKLLGARF